MDEKRSNEEKKSNDLSSKPLSVANTMLSNAKFKVEKFDGTNTSARDNTKFWMCCFNKIWTSL